MRTPLVLVAGLLVAGTAHADRFERAAQLFHGACVSCHTVGWNHEQHERGRVDLTRAVDHRGAADLARFLADPAAERPGTPCKHVPLLPNQVDDMIAYLQIHASDPPKRATVAPPSRHVVALPAVLRIPQAPAPLRREGKGK